MSCVVILTAIFSHATATELLYILSSPNEEDHGYFGYTVSGAGDVNNDGSHDVIVGAYRENGGFPDAGRAYVFSGQTGGIFYSLVSPDGESDGHFGTSVSGAGDVNNDGYDDIIVGAPDEWVGTNPDAGRAYVFSGLNSTCLHTLASPNPESGGSFGSSVSAAGDVNNDGYDDVIVGAYLEDAGGINGSGRAYVFSGLTGAPLLVLASPNGEALGYFGCSVSGVLDVNFDGHDEVIVGAYNEDPAPSPGGSGRAYIFNGETGVLLHELISPNEESDGNFGWSVSGAGIVNHDGRGDAVVGAPHEDPGSTPTDAGMAYVFDGFTGLPLHTVTHGLTQEANGLFGSSVSGAGDVNGNGYDDVVVGAYLEDVGSTADAGRAYLFSGQTGLVMNTMSFAQSFGYFGCSVSGAGDVNQDGRPDVIVGAYRQDPGSSPTDAGRAYVYSLAPGMGLYGYTTPGYLVLEWTACPEAQVYWIYGADNLPFFVPGLGNPYPYRLATLPAGTTTWSSTFGIGNPNHNWTYLVIAMSDFFEEMCRSNRFGEFDFQANIP